MPRYDNKSIAKNSVMLLIMNIAKLVFPLLTLPYLTRILSTDCYGVTAYVKATMSYMQIIVDFGFLYSATKDIVKHGTTKKQIGIITGDTLAAKLILSLAGFVVLIVLIFVLPILRAYPLFTILSYFNIVLSVFLLDFLFRGIEKMQVLTLRFVLMKSISTALTFVFVHNDSDIMWIPILDILGSVAAIIFVFKKVREYGIHLRITNLHNIIDKLKDSSVYFISNMASTSVGALNTIVIGLLLSTTDVAFWSVCNQLVSAAIALYDPIINGVYPAMIKRRELNLIKKIMKIFVPLIFCGCILAYFLTKIGLRIVGGANYVAAAPVFRLLIPVLFFAFPGMLLGFPSLGSINKASKVSKSTVITVLFQCAGLFILWVCGHFTLLSVAVLRSLTEFVMFTVRAFYVFRYRNRFAEYKMSTVQS
jgi:PST family polysaccharide transporter